ncbi:MAG: VOC family protein, partial [Jannaschia helgolandensis]
APTGHPGLYHRAVLYPDRPSLARALRRVMAAGVRLTGKADHGVSEALYFDDPDGNGVELYRDRPSPSAGPRRPSPGAGRAPATGGQDRERRCDRDRGGPWARRLHRDCPMC